MANQFTSSWTPEELERLRRIYPTHTKRAILMAFPGRSWGAIKGKAHRLRINRKTWSRGEIDALTALYPSAPREDILARLKTRSWPSIRAKANRLGLERVRR